VSLEKLSLLLLLLQLAATLYLVGLVWFVQWVHYPLFAGVGSEAFPAYEMAHMARTGPVVGPPMLVEAASAVALVALRPAGIPVFAPWLGVALLAVIWLSTLLLQVPRHRELAAGFDRTAHRRLVATNWVRTLAWSLRGGLVLWLVFAVSTRGAAGLA
jgi:hypothetical protein